MLEPDTFILEIGPGFASTNTDTSRNFARIWNKVCAGAGYDVTAFVQARL